MTHAQPSEPKPEPRKPDPDSEFFVVGIGGSAGALDAFSELLRRLPAHCRLAVVIVQHLGAEHESLLVDLLSRVATLPVRWATENEPVHPGHVYVGPPGRAMTVQGGVIALHAGVARTPAAGIDFLFQSLAKEYNECAVGVILSGNGSDGTLGLKAIKTAGGFTFAQSEKTATYRGMPRAAIASGCVDQILTASEIAAELARLASGMAHDGEAFALKADAEESPLDDLAAIFRLLSSRTGVDFAQYKQSTIQRRLMRRMILTKTKKVGDYLEILRKSRDEVDALYGSLLINVTEFFRDPDTFEYLRETVLPEILARQPHDRPLRIWVPGCSTGEEAYSFAILASELLAARERVRPVQIFGTDVSQAAIAVARAGVYGAAELA